MKNIADSHNKSNFISSSMITVLESTPTVSWLVTSSTDTTHNYIVKQIEQNCNGCQLVCVTCNICLHSYKCSCCDNMVNYNICKDIHAIAQLTKSVNINQQTHIQGTLEEVYSNVQSMNEEKYSRRAEIKVKAECILRLNNNICISDADLALVSKYLDKATCIMNKNQNRSLHEKTVNTNKKLEPQVSTKERPAKQIGVDSLNSSSSTDIIDDSEADPDYSLSEIKASSRKRRRLNFDIVIPKSIANCE
ncbi:hypothetical protein FQR65_LT16771 [Abscondita terminalis]|nr:hypothetical protein FQR65_LT16771 [Abscondita terminalis]